MFSTKPPDVKYVTNHGSCPHCGHLFMTTATADPKNLGPGIMTVCPACVKFILWGENRERTVPTREEVAYRINAMSDGDVGRLIYFLGTLVIESQTAERSPLC